MTTAKIVEELKAEIVRINKAIQLLSGTKIGVERASRKGRKMSKEAIEKIRASQKKRWEAIKKKNPKD